MRVRDWRVAFAFLLLCGLVETSWGACPLLAHADPDQQREFMNLCSQIASSPLVTAKAGAPAITPRRVGDIYISTTTAKVYIATATATSGSWVVVN